MKTVYCCGCQRVINRFFEEKSQAEDLLSTVCEDCKRALKTELDQARQILHEQEQVDPVVNQARRILFEQGVT